jgi:hypothetical protein
VVLRCVGTHTKIEFKAKEKAMKILEWYMILIVYTEAMVRE